MLFSRFSVVLAQNSKIASTIKRLGAPNVATVGNLKIDAPPPPVDAAGLNALNAAIAGRPVFLAASTHPGEDIIIAAAHQIIRREIPGLLTVIVPRHPDRGAALANAMMGQGLAAVQRSLSGLPIATTEIYIADTIGELGTFYALSPVAFVGGSLIAHGGQNPIEAVRHSSAVLTGPHHHNFREPYDSLIAAEGARVVTNADEIARAAMELLSDPAALQRMRDNAVGALEDLGGALNKTIAAIRPFLSKLET